MNIDERNEKNKAYTGFRAAVDLSMGLIYVIVALYCLYFPWVLAQFGKMNVYILVSLFALYGAFRLYRGIVQFKNSIKRK